MYSSCFRSCKFQGSQCYAQIKNPTGNRGERAVDDAIASSNAQIDQLTTQLSTLTEERNDLETRLTEVTALGEDLSIKLALSEAEVSKHSANVSNLESQVEALITDRDTAIEKMNEVLSSKGVSDEVLLSLYSFDVKLDSVQIKIESKAEGENMVFIRGF
jgi:outer membrane murein-binding lipoprotein Lpp